MSLRAEKKKPQTQSFWGTVSAPQAGENKIDAEKNSHNNNNHSGNNANNEDSRHSSNDHNNNDYKNAHNDINKNNKIYRE